MNKQATSAIILLLLMGTSFLFTSFSQVQGQLGVNIYLATPQEAPARTLVNVQGTIDTTNGTYELYLGGKVVATDKSEGFYVNANFTVPELPAGDYTMTLRDVARRVNATDTFKITVGYYITANAPSPPALLQEGSQIALNVTLTGGTAGTTYQANITVELPSPLGTEYTRSITLTAATQTGTAHTELPFPSPDFQPSGAVTNFTGLYSAYFNKTEQLASSQFFIGLTDASQYHRAETVTIRAVGYEANQAAALSITNQDGANVHSASVTATSEGIINAAWTVPNNALIGTYEVKIAPEGTTKTIADAQNITVPGYPIRIRTVNLAGEIVSGIAVEALDQATDKTYTATSGEAGIAIVNLEKGGNNVTAYWNEVKVGEIILTITGENSYDLTCRLTNLKIIVQDKNGFKVPFVALNVTYRYTTTKQGSSRTGSASGQTDISGAFALDSVLPGIAYTISASVYRVVFNANNNTFTDIPAVPTHEIIILLPSRLLTLKIIDYTLKGLPNARLALFEQKSGIFYANLTDADGSSSIEVAFGKYQLRVYKDNILLNETVIEAFNDTQAEIRCVLYNLQVSVAVVDFFNQPVSNVNVDFRGPDQITRSTMTSAEGIATFSNVIGGDSQVLAYSNGRQDYYEAINLRVESPTAVQIKMGRFVLLAGLLVETSLFLTLVIILPVLVVFILFEVYRRKRLQSAKTEAKAEAASK